MTSCVVVSLVPRCNHSRCGPFFSDFQPHCLILHLKFSPLLSGIRRQKTRRLKDQRLALDKDVLCLESGFVSGMRDIVAAKAAAADAKKSKKKAPRAKKNPAAARPSKKPSSRKKKPAEKVITASDEMAQVFMN